MEGDDNVLSSLAKVLSASRQKAGRVALLPSSWLVNPTELHNLSEAKHALPPRGGVALDYQLASLSLFCLPSISSSSARGTRPGKQISWGQLSNITGESEARAVASGSIILG